MKRKKRGKNEALQKEYEEFFSEDGENICQICGSPLKIGKTNLKEYEGGKFYQIKDVPAFVCEQCGETWVPKPFMDEFEKMKEAVKGRKKGKKRKR
jgi:YgiT-type zinc finger domain-containing protein